MYVFSLKPGAHIFPIHNSFQNFRKGAFGNHHIDARMDADFRSLDFCVHAACSLRRTGTAGHTEYIPGKDRHLVDKTGILILAGI